MAWREFRNFFFYILKLYLRVTYYFWSVLQASSRNYASASVVSLDRESNSISNPSCTLLNSAVRSPFITFSRRDTAWKARARSRQDLHVKTVREGETWTVSNTSLRYISYSPSIFYFKEKLSLIFKITKKKKNERIVRIHYSIEKCCRKFVLNARFVWFFFSSLKTSARNQARWLYHEYVYIRIYGIGFRLR